jgi:RNA polymerase sigma-70 factor (ECF subfamily)
MDEKLLIERARGGDDDAFGELVRLHQDRVYRTAVRLVGPEDAHDITQEVFIKAHGELKRFRARSALSTWLYRMTVNLSLNYLRGSKREKDRRERYGPGVSDPPPNQEKSLLDQEFTQAVWDVIDSLPERQRSAIVLHRFEELSAAETALVMGLSLGAVESLLHRAKQALLESFQEKGLRPHRGEKSNDRSSASNQEPAGSSG